MPVTESGFGGAVAHLALSPRPMTLAALDLAPRALWLLLIGAVLLVGAWAAPRPDLAIVLIVPAMVFVILAVLVRVLSFRHARAEGRLYETIAEFVANDAAPSLTADRDGVIGYINASGRGRFGDAVGQTLVSVLGEMFASPGAVLYRLQNKALAMGAAREDLVLKQGHMRLSVHRVGQGGFLWRLEDIGATTMAGRSGEHIALPMMSVSKSGTILFMNEALRRLLGGRESTIDRVFTDLPLRPGEVHHLSGQDGPEPVQVIEVALSAGRRELYLAPATGHGRVAPGEWGVIDSLPVPLLRLGRDGRVTMSNRRARHLLKTDAVVGQHLSSLVEDLGRPVSDWLREAWAGRNLGRTETVRTSGRDERFLQITLEQFEDEDGRALVAVLNDATELKSIERQFAQSQKMQLIGQLAGGVAHDFNNLLTAISGHCDLLLLSRDAEDPDYADLSQIAQNANRAAAVVNQLLGFSRKQRLRPETLDLADTISDLTHLLGRLVGERVQLELDVDPRTQKIRADKFQLEQVLTNLVVNARDAMMPAGGRIRMKLANLYLDRPLERDRAVVPAGDYVSIQVIDEGTGIPADQVEKIFEPFFSTKGTKGTGLGLSMAYGIVKQSGGFIFVDTVEGSGTTFSLYFPVLREDRSGRPVSAVAPEAGAVDGTAAEGARAAPPLPSVADIAPRGVRVDTGVPSGVVDPGARGASAPADTPTAAGATRGAATAPVTAEARPQHSARSRDSGKEGGVILLVEDEAPVRAFASRALRLKGYTVLEADSAEEALATLEDASLDVDLFVSDVIMPGMDGPSWVTEALKARPGVKVVFVSGYAEDSIAEHQARIPNSVFLPKPFSLVELTSTVGEQLAAH